MPLSLPENLPVFDLASASETGASTNLDWPNATHDAIPISTSTIPEETRSWQVRQSLEGASGITALLKSGKAVYAVEARCLHTAWCELFLGENDSNVVTVEAPLASTRGNIHLCPGVLTLEDCELDIEDLHEIKRPVGRSTISIPAGYWLVLGRPIPVYASEKESMIYFEDDQNLEEGQMRISPMNHVEDVRFRVLLSPSDYRTLQANKMFQWSCLLTAFAMLPSVEDYDIEENADGTPLVKGSIIGQSLANELHAKDIPLWDDKNDWDPARALTASGLLVIPIPLQDDN